jgi:hypothetical protein
MTVYFVLKLVSWPEYRILVLAIGNLKIIRKEIGYGNPNQGGRRTEANCEHFQLIAVNSCLYHQVNILFVLLILLFSLGLFFAFLAPSFQ